jgi:hypothetical protein
MLSNRKLRLDMAQAHRAARADLDQYRLYRHSGRRKETSELPDSAGPNQGRGIACGFSSHACEKARLPDR